MHCADKADVRHGQHKYNHLLNLLFSAKNYVCVFLFFFYIMRKGTVLSLRFIFKTLDPNEFQAWKKSFEFFLWNWLKKLEPFRGVYSIAQCSCKYLHKFPVFVCLSFSIINFFL